MHEFAIAAQLVRKAGSGVALRRGAKRAEQPVEHLGRACLVEACGDGAINAAKVEAGFQCGRDKFVAVFGRFDGDGVEELVMAHAATGGAHRRGKPAGQAVRVAGDPFQPFRTVPQGVETGHHGQKHLRRADVRGRLFAADMLLAGLKGKTIGHAAGAVLADADKSPRDRTLMRGAAGKERRVRAAIAERHAETLRRSEDDVGTKVARRLDDRQRQKVGRDDGKTANRLNGLDGRTDVAHPAAASRIADESAEISFVTRRVGILDTQLDADRLGAGFQNRQRLWVGVGIDAEDRSLGAMRPKRHRHPLGGGGGFVKKRAVGDVHAGQLDHHRLEIEDRLETPLRNFRLVRV